MIQVPSYNISLPAVTLSAPTSTATDDPPARASPSRDGVPSISAAAAKAASAMDGGTSWLAAQVDGGSSWLAAQVERERERAAGGESVGTSKTAKATSMALGILSALATPEKKKKRASQR